MSLYYGEQSYSCNTILQAGSILQWCSAIDEWQATGTLPFITRSCAPMWFRLGLLVYGCALPLFAVHVRCTSMHCSTECGRVSCLR